MTENQIWDKLKSFGLNDFAAAGIIGNLFAESGLNAENLQNSGHIGAANKDFLITRRQKEHPLGIPICSWIIFGVRYRGIGA